MISFKIHKSTISLFKLKKMKEKEKIAHNYLITKYSSFKYSYSLLCIKNLIFTEHCRIVARFKDFLILDDMTEFLRRFYSKKELKNRLIKIFNFYESYSKIFPNYMILAESKYLYRNIRKKQKMIDAFNQIKKEEEENRNSLKKEKKEKIKIFNKSIEESINRYHPSGGSSLFNSIISGFIKNNNINNNESNWNSLISVSLNNQNSLNNKIINSNRKELSKKNSKLNSFEINGNENNLNSESSLVNIILLLNKKYDNYGSNTIDKNNNKNNTYNNQKNINNKNIYNNQNSINKYISNYHNGHKNNRIFVKNVSRLKNLYKINISNEGNLKKEKNKFEKINNINNNNISSSPKNISPNHTHTNKQHNHHQSALNNNKKFISHKQAVSTSNNNGNNSIKIINHINNIIINDSNINKEMVININTNYFELNNTNLNILNKINNNNIHKNIKNNLFKKIKINSKNKSKEVSILKKEINYQKNINNNCREKNNLINNTLEEERIHSKKILNFENHHYNTNSNNINYSNNNIINNNIINIHNNTVSQINNASKNNKNKTKKQNNLDNKRIKKLMEYKTICINNIKKNDSIKNNRLKRNYDIFDKNKKDTIIDMENYEKIRKSGSRQRKKLETIIGTEAKKIAKKPIFNPKIQNKRTMDIMIMDDNINYNANANTLTSYYYTIDHNNSHILNPNKKNDYLFIRSSQIRSKLNKKIITRKQKTNSLHINNRKKNNIIKELNSLRSNNNINIRNNNFLNDHIKNFTQVNLSLEKKSKKNIIYKNSKNTSKNKLKKISAKEMKEKYHKFMNGNKIIHGSYDTSNRLHLFKKFSSLYNNSNMNNYNFNFNNITEISHRKIIDKKSPYKFSNILNTPANKNLNKNVNNINNNIVRNSYENLGKLSYKGKMKLNKRDENFDKNRHFIYRINKMKNQIFIINKNNIKMKFIKK